MPGHNRFLGLHRLVAVVGRSLVLWVIVAWAAPAHAQLVNFTSVPLPAGPGSVQGMVDAGTVQPFVGAYEYSLPVEVPEYAGLAPRLAISYSSAAGHGLLGGGWTITVPLIRRSLRNGPPTYTSSDQLELVGFGGGRLIADPALPDRYWVEGRGKALRVKFVTGWFEITDSDGTLYTFGANTTTQLSSSNLSRIAEWRLQTIRTLAGTTVAFGYLKDQLQLYPSSVTWGPSQAGTPVFRIDFVYELRPDQVINYRHGFRVVTRQRLKTLTVKAFGEAARSYSFAYETGSGPSRLSSIQQFGRNGGSGLNPLKFTYANVGRITKGPSGNFSGFTPGVSAGAIWLDLDRDGFNDLIKFPASGDCPYRRNLDNGSFSAQTTTPCPPSALAFTRLVDFDGDGFLDLAKIPNSGAWSYYHVKDLGFQAKGTWSGTNWMTGSVVFIDVNGDGRPDAVNPLGAQGVDYALNSPTGFGPKLHLNPSSSNNLANFDGRRVIDFNHDGLIDYYSLTTGQLRLYFGRGDMTFEPLVQVPFTSQQSASTLLANPDRLRIGDFDKDGFADAIEISPTNFYFYRGKGDMGGFESRITFANPGGSVFVQSVLDLNGNGSLDLYSFTTDSRLWYVDLAGLNGAGKGPFLGSLDPGLGATVSVLYSSTGSLSMADEVANEPWPEQIPLSFPVVTRVNENLGPNAIGRAISHRPASPYWDPEERSMAGFQQNTKTFHGTTDADTLVTVSYFNPGIGELRETRGLKNSEEYSDGFGNDLGFFFSSLGTLAVDSLPSDPRLRVPAKHYHYSETGGPGSKATETWFVHDTDGRTVRQINNGRLDVTGDEVINEWDYVTSDNQTWVRDKVCKTRLLRGDSTPVADSRHLYGDNTTTQPLCVPGKGWPREDQDYLDTEDRYVTTWARSYDAIGNPIVEFDGRVSASIAYDSLSLYPTSRTVRPMRTSSLVWGIQMDAVLGRVLQVTHPDSTVTVYTYDAIGRLTTEAKQGLPAHVRYEYAWNGNFTGLRPKTTTWVFDGDTTELSNGSQPWPTGSKWRASARVMNGLMEPVFDSVLSATGKYVISGYVERDARGRVTRNFEPFYSSSAEPTTVIEGTRNASTTFDAFGRPLVKLAGNGADTVFNYDGMTETVWRPDANAEVTEYDGLGRVIRVQRWIGEVEEYADYVYDAMGNPTQVMLQGGSVVSTFAYDSLGRLTDATDPDSGNQGWTYDDRGFVLTHVNGAGNLIRLSYDDVGRLTRKGEGILPNARDYIFFYDTPKFPGDTRTKGRLAWVDEPDGELQFSYDVFGRPSSVTRTVTGATAVRTPTFSPSGLPLRESFDDGFSISNTYDKAGRLTAAGSYWIADELDAAGRTLRERFGNGVSEVHTFDALGLPDRVTVMRSTGTRIIDIDIDRDRSGRPSTVVDFDGIGIARAASFTYDQGGRLNFADYTDWDANTLRWFQWGYDPLQNFMYHSAGDAFGTLANGWYNYGENGHGPRQLTSITPWSSNAMPTSFDYDGAGRQTREFDATLAYDGFDRLTGISTPPGLLGPGGQNVNVQYTYGADGLRTSIANAQGTRERWFDSNWREVNGQRQHLISVGQRLVAQVTRTGGTPLIVYFHQGLSAGPEMITSSSGAVLEDRFFEPFGYPVAVSSSASFDFLGKPINGVNQFTDSASGFSFHGARWYTPEVGRWLSPDPAVAVPSRSTLLRPWGLNPYQYAGQNPMAFWDSDGWAPGRFNVYSTREEARAAGNTDIFIAQQNYGVEHSTRVYYSADAGGYFYTSPHFGSPQYPLGHPQRVQNDLNRNEVIPDDAVAVEYSHSHPRGRKSSDADKDNAKVRDLDFIDSYFVDPDGNIRRITQDGHDEIVDTVDPVLLDQLADYNYWKAREEESMTGVAAAFLHGDQMRALMLDWYKLYKDPPGYAMKQASEATEGHWWSYLPFY